MIDVGGLTVSFGSQTLFENVNLRNKMGKANRELAIEKFDLVQIVNKVIKLYY